MTNKPALIIITLITVILASIVGYRGVTDVVQHRQAVACERAGGDYTTVNPNDERTYACWIRS